LFLKNTYARIAPSTLLKHEKKMSIIKKKVRIHTRFQFQDSFAFTPTIHTINEKVATYYFGPIPFMSFTLDSECVPKDTRRWKSKFDLESICR